MVGRMKCDMAALRLPEKGSGADMVKYGEHASVVKLLCSQVYAKRNMYYEETTPRQSHLDYCSVGCTL